MADYLLKMMIMKLTKLLYVLFLPHYSYHIVKEKKENIDFEKFQIEKNIY